MSVIVHLRTAVNIQLQHIYVGLVGTSCDKSILIGKSWQAGGGGGGEAAHLVVNWSNPTKEMELAGSVLKAAQKGKNTLRD